MIKIGFKRLVATSMIAATLMVAQNALISANNFEDSYFSVRYSGDGSEDIITAPRPKEDDTASYVNNNGPDTTNINACVYGYGSKGYEVRSCVVRVNKNGKRYIGNTVRGGVKQSCLKKASLGASTVNHKAHNMTGWWSPDNYRMIKDTQ